MLTFSYPKAVHSAVLCGLLVPSPAINAAPADVDDDGVLDAVDNCTSVANPRQLDTDEDGYGNACDADLNNDGIVNVVDLGALRSVFFATDEPAADLNGDGVVNVADLGVFRTLFFAPPGPSALAPVPPGLGSVIDAIAALPEGEWYLASNNLFSDVWTPEALRPLKDGSNPTPDRIIAAWSGFGWDSNRAQLILYGGGHATYSGNDVYAFRAATGLWERAALPSEITLNSLGEYESIDGVDAAPGSAHTYDNALFLPQFDRYLNFGGAQWNSGGPFIRVNDDETFALTGPYFFDPSRADANSVGGTTGSHVQREGPYPDITGGNMWVNRDIYANATFLQTSPSNFVNGTTAYASENGHEVVYFGARVGTNTSPNLFKLTMPSLADATLDTVELIGVFNSGPGNRSAAAYDPVNGVFLRTGSFLVPFTYWNVNTPGVANRDVNLYPQDQGGDYELGVDYGIDFDPIRRHFAMWKGGPDVHTLTAPEPLNANGWVLRRAPSATLAAPAGPVDNGVLGKWKYASNLDVFVGLRDSVAGSVWYYKPVGWRAPPRGVIATRYVE
ncbi:MAG: thrombospondin type 3 repeat-containing protein [Gammaproteobacteria bacterium]